MKNEEIWKTYPEFDFIQGSNFGRVRTLDRYVKQGNKNRFVRGRILKQQTDRGGYLYVHFRADGKFIHRKIHRIIASCFVSNPDNLPQVNHRDCNRSNNCVDNLEWCDASYNQRYVEAFGKARGRYLIAISLNTLSVSRFPSQNEASRVLGVNVGNINGVLKGRQKTSGGFWFCHADENVVEKTQTKFGNDVASKVAELMKYGEQ